MQNEDVLQGFLSKDANRVLVASNEVRKSIITNRGMIEALFPYIDEIEAATCNLSYGGTIMPNWRFVHKALMIIRDSRKKACLCEYAFEDYGQSVKMLGNYGFKILSERVEREKYTTIGEIECPLCHQRYIAEEEFTGWHMTTSRHRKVEE